MKKRRNLQFKCCRWNEKLNECMKNIFLLLIHHWNDAGSVCWLFCVNWAIKILFNCGKAITHWVNKLKSSFIHFFIQSIVIECSNLLRKIYYIELKLVAITNYFSELIVLLLSIILLTNYFVLLVIFISMSII